MTHNVHCDFKTERESWICCLCGENDVIVFSSHDIYPNIMIGIIKKKRIRIYSRFQKWLSTRNTFHIVELHSHSDVRDTRRKRSHISSSTITNDTSLARLLVSSVEPFVDDSIGQRTSNWQSQQSNEVKNALLPFGIINGCSIFEEDNFSVIYSSSPEAFIMFPTSGNTRSMCTWSVELLAQCAYTFTQPVIAATTMTRTVTSPSSSSLNCRKRHSTTVLYDNNPRQKNM